MASADCGSAAHVRPHTIIPVPSPINLGLARTAAQSISDEIWAVVTALTDFGMQGSPLIDKETEINSQLVSE